MVITTKSLQANLFTTKAWAKYLASFKLKSFARHSVNFKNLTIDNIFDTICLRFRQNLSL